MKKQRLFHMFVLVHMSIMVVPAWKGIEDYLGYYSALSTCRAPTVHLRKSKYSMYNPLYIQPSASLNGRYRFAAVAADHEECSKIGNYVMAVQGGSAVDAAIAALLCVGIHHTHSAGIGGGNMLTLYKRRSNEVHTVIAREQAPSKASEEYFTKGVKINPNKGGKAIAVPGEVRGMYEAWLLGGRLPWKQLFQPAIKLCTDGITVGKILANAMFEEEHFAKEFSNFKQFITNPSTGQLYMPGEIMKRPKLARTLNIIADEGPDAFYTGTLADDIIADIQEAGGIITKEDLANYTAMVKPPAKFRLQNNYTIYSPPPPSSGPVFQFILNILDGYKFNTDSVSSVSKATRTWHRVIEAFKHGYAMQAKLEVDSNGSLVKKLTDSKFGEFIRNRIDDKATYQHMFYNTTCHPHTDRGTTHVSVLGPNGDAVSISSSVHMYFGPKVIGSRTGIVFNNQMRSFSRPGFVNEVGLPESRLNAIRPGKFPLSSMSPSVIVGPDDEVKLIIGAAGGIRIVSTNVLVTLGVLNFGWSLKESIDYPRIHHQVIPQAIQAQKEFPKVILDGLRDIGHNITIRVPYRCMVHAIAKDTNDIFANCDYRKGGVPDGF